VIFQPCQAIRNSKGSSAPFTCVMSRDSIAMTLTCWMLCRAAVSKMRAELAKLQVRLSSAELAVVYRQ